MIVFNFSESFDIIQHHFVHSLSLSNTHPYYNIDNNITEINSYSKGKYNLMTFIKDVQTRC